MPDRRAFETAVWAWEQADTRLQAYAVTARRDPPGMPTGAVPLWVGARPDEGVLYAGPDDVGGSTGSAPAARLLAVPDGWDLSGATPFDPVDFELTSPAARAGVEGRVIDTGRVAVTTRRLVFVGGERREWAYGSTAEFLVVPGRAGLVIRDPLQGSDLVLVVEPVATLDDMRFALSLGLAERDGRREALLEQLERVSAVHRTQRPEQPEPSELSEAPAAVTRTAVPVSPPVSRSVPAGPRPPRRGRGRILLAVAALVLVVALAIPALRACGGGCSARAPDNPYGYNFCGGSLVHRPKRDVCKYFDCIDGFWSGKGFMVQCGDGKFSMSGGIEGACSRHRDQRRPVFQR